MSIIGYQYKYHHDNCSAFESLTVKTGFKLMSKLECKNQCLIMT